MKHPSFALLLLLPFLISACASKGPTQTQGTRVRELTERAMANSIILVVDADDYNGAAMIRGVFTGRLYTVQISVTGWTGGSVLLRVIDLGGNVLHLDSLASDTAYSCTLTSPATPWALDYSIASFTGRLTCRVQRGMPGAGQFGASLLPVSPGCRWRYLATFDGLLEDTVTVAVEGDTVMGDGTPASIWRYRGRAWTHEAACYAIGDTIITAFFGEELRPEVRLVFPLVDGRTWTGPGSYFLVDSTLSLPLLSGDMVEAWNVIQILDRNPSSDYVQHLMVPGLGLARQTYHYRDPIGRSVDRVWDLIEVSVVVHEEQR